MSSDAGISVSEAVAERLSTMDEYRDVLGALDIAGLRAPPRMPAAFVLPLSESAGENRAPGAGAVQQVTATIGVAIVLAAPGDPGGTRARDQLTDVLQVTRARLTGWRPGPRYEPLAFRRGQLLEVDEGRVMWQDEFETRCWIEATGVKER